MASIKSSSTSIGEEDARGMRPTSLLDFLWRIGEEILGAGPAGERGITGAGLSAMRLGVKLITGGGAKGSSLSTSRSLPFVDGLFTERSCLRTGVSIGGLPTSDLISIRGFAGIRGREAADLLVDMDAELPGLRGATSADKGMSSESLSESDEVSESSSFVALGDKGDGKDFSDDKAEAFAAAKVDARRAAALGVRALVEADALARTAAMLSGRRSCTLSNFDGLGGSGC